MGMWEFGGICELLCKLLFELPKVGVGAFVFAPKGCNPAAEKKCVPLVLDYLRKNKIKQESFARAPIFHLGLGH